MPSRAFSWGQEEVEESRLTRRRGAGLAEVGCRGAGRAVREDHVRRAGNQVVERRRTGGRLVTTGGAAARGAGVGGPAVVRGGLRSEEHTSELQSREHLL